MNPSVRPSQWSLWIVWPIWALAAGITVAAMALMPLWGALPALLGAWAVGGVLLVGRRLLLDLSGGDPLRKLLIGLVGSTCLLVFAEAGAIAFTGKWPWQSGPGIVLLVMFASSWTFVAALALVRLLLTLPWAPLSVARAVIDEAINLRVVIGLFALLLLLVPVLPFVLSTDQPLRYRMQQFLGYSMSATTFMLSFFTVAFACWTLSNEIREKQIFTVMTKPLGRAQFLLGKWLGVVLLDAVLLIVAGVGIAGFTQFYLARQPAQDQMDALAVREEVLAARVKSEPRPAKPFEETVADRIAALHRTDPQALLDLGRGAATEAGILESDLNEEKLMAMGAERAYDQLLKQARQEWQSLGPNGTASFAQVYVFEGLDRAAEYGDAVYLRFKIKGATGTETPIGIQVNNSPREQFMAATNIVQRQPIRVEWVDNEGRMVVTLANLNPNESITFAADNGLQMLYTVGRFGPNFLRAMMLSWLKMAYLAALGLAVATFLGFAVALLGGLLVTGGIYVAGYVLSSIKTLQLPAITAVADVLSFIMNLIAVAFTTPLAVFSSFSPVTDIVEGTYISWTQVFSCIGWVGLLWTGVTGVIAWLIFRRRELARVQV